MKADVGNIRAIIDAVDNRDRMPMVASEMNADGKTTEHAVEGLRKRNRELQKDVKWKRVGAWCKLSFTFSFSRLSAKS